MELSREMAKTACHALQEKKAEEVRVIEISEISPEESLDLLRHKFFQHETPPVWHEVKMDSAFQIH